MDDMPKTVLYLSDCESSDDEKDAKISPELETEPQAADIPKPVMKRHAAYRFECDVCARKYARVDSLTL